MPKSSSVRHLLSLLVITSCSADPDAPTLVGGSKEPLVDNGNLTTQLFCPNALVPRKDMARYLLRMKYGRDYMPPPAQNRFDDVENDSVEAAWIEQLYADGITAGTSPTTFAPNDTTPREQMAAFIVRLIHGPDFHRDGPSRFTDVTNPLFIGYIEQLADDGITKGCTATEFCPSDMVPRDQMAAFLMRALHPGTPEPPMSGRFADVPDYPLAGRIEQAVAEGIMEPCGEMIDGEVVGGPDNLEDPDHPPPTIHNFLGWLGNTPNYGEYTYAGSKRYWNDNHRIMCGGDYNVTMTLDIGEVSSDGVYVYGVRFWTTGVPRVMHQDFVWVGTNGNIDKFTYSEIALDDFGTPYIYFPVNRWFSGGTGDAGDALQVQHTMIPEGQLDLFSTTLVDGPNGRAAVTFDLTDNPDGGFCAMILRGALPTYR